MKEVARMQRLQRQKLGFAAILNVTFYTGKMLLFVQFSFHRL